MIKAQANTHGDDVNIVQAHTDAHLPEVRKLFMEYAESLGFDLCFENFDKEVAGLPGEYAPPTGLLLVAADRQAIAGCVAVRKVAEGICEMKRLYVRPAYRGRGLGKKLVVDIISRAKQLGYDHMRLHTLPVMKEAVSMYRSMGFYPIEPYSSTPVEGSFYMELKL